MDTSEKEVEVAARVDLSQYENMVANPESWKRDVAVQTEALEQTLPAREKAAKEILAFADVPPSDRQNAEQVLAECSRKRAKLEASIVGTKRLIESYDQRIAPLRPAYERQKERERLAAKLRGEL
jgi:predicted TIM-barrel fold metal-dependent hydrolase